MKAFEYENQGSGSYLVYKIGADENINTFVLGMTSNNNLEGILKMSKLQLDGEIQIRYLISAKRELAEYLKNERLTRDIILDMLYRISQTVINANEYMIRQDEFILDVQYIYVDPNTKKPYLMLTPVKDRGVVNENLDIFIKNFIYSIGYTDEILINTVNKIMGMLNRCSGIVEFRDLIRLEMTNKSVVQSGMAVQGQQPLQHVQQSAEQHVRQENQPVASSNAQIPFIKNILKPKDNQEPEQRAVSISEVRPIQNTPVQSTDGKGDKIKVKNPDVKVNIPFAVPGLQNGTNVPSHPQKDEEKGKKGIFGLFGKDKKAESAPIVNADIKVPAQPSNVNAVRVAPVVPGVPVVPVVPNNMQAPKQPAQCVQGYTPPTDSNTILIGGYSNSSAPYLYRTQSGENIQITKDYFKLGRSSTDVDYQILNNNAIGRFHAAIIRRGNEYYICDQGSMNHTFVNGVQLKKDQEVMIQNDSHIRMANEEFIFRMNM